MADQDRDKKPRIPPPPPRQPDPSLKGYIERENKSRPTPESTDTPEPPGAR